MARRLLLPALALVLAGGHGEHVHLQQPEELEEIQLDTNSWILADTHRRRKALLELKLDLEPRVKGAESDKRGAELDNGLHAGDKIQSINSRLLDRTRQRRHMLLVRQRRKKATNRAEHLVNVNKKRTGTTSSPDFHPSPLALEPRKDLAAPSDQARPAGPGRPGKGFLKLGTGKKSDDSPSTPPDPTQPVDEGPNANPPQLAGQSFNFNFNFNLLDKDGETGGETGGAAKSKNPERKEAEPNANDVREVEVEVDTTVQPEVGVEVDTTVEVEEDTTVQPERRHLEESGGLNDVELIFPVSEKLDTELHKLETNLLNTSNNQDKDGGENAAKNKEVLTEITTVDNESVISELDEHAETTTHIAQTTTNPTDIVCELDNTTARALTDLSECPTADSVITTDSPNTGPESTELDEALAGLELEGVELSGRDRRIMLTLMELEGLRGQQVDMREEIQDKLIELEDLLDENEVDGELDGPEEKEPNVSEGSGSLVDDDGLMEARGGKSLGNNFVQTVGSIGQIIPGLLVAKVQHKVETVRTTLHLFDNIQGLIVTLLQARIHFLHLISATIERDLEIFRQTIEFLQRLVNFKLDQSEILLGNGNPITEILQSGSTSIFLIVTRFFDAVEAVFALKEDFLRAFSGESTDTQEVDLLERIQQLKLKTILPKKMRLLLNIHAHSEELKDMIDEIFGCVGELVEAKQDLIRSVGSFVDTQVQFLSGLTGPGMTVPTLIEAVQTGTLYKLANWGPEDILGVPGLSPAEVEELVEQLLAGAGEGPSVPLLGPVKPLLVDHRLLGALAGRARDRLVNRFLARRLGRMLAGSPSVVRVRQGETLVRTRFPPVSLGAPCTNEVHLGRSLGTVTVARSSRFSATTGLTLNSHGPPSADLIGHADLHVNLDLASNFRSSLGKRLFGQCISKLSGSSPMRMRGRAYGHAYAKVVVSAVKLEVRPTAPSPVLGNILHLQLGVERPHLVFTFAIKLDGTLHKFDISSLKLSGCEFKILGIKMFSMCGLVEKMVRDQVRRATRNSFPLRAAGLLRDIERAIQMAVGTEVAIPLVLMDGPNLAPANRVILKTRRLIELNTRLFHALVSLTQDMVQAEGE